MFKYIHTANKLEDRLLSLCFGNLFLVKKYFHISYGELSHENFEFNLSDFCKVYKLPILVTYNSLKTLDHESIILLDESYNRKSTVKFIISNNKVFEYLENNKSH